MRIVPPYRLALVTVLTFGEDGRQPSLQATREPVQPSRSWRSGVPGGRGFSLDPLRAQFDSRHRMKTPRNLGWVAFGLFIISHFLPAYDTASGFGCFRECWNMLSGRNTEMLSGGWFYYSGFVISNIFFIGLVIALAATKRLRRVRFAVSIVLFLHVFSWLVLHIVEQPSQIPETIRIGYYAWLIAYGLLVAAHLWKEPIEAESFQPIPFTDLAA